MSLRHLGCDECGGMWIGKETAHDAKCLVLRIDVLEAERDKLTERLLAHERIEMDLMAQRDALKARVEKLVYALEVTENEIGTVQDSSSQQSWRKIVKAALAEDGGGK